MWNLRNNWFIILWNCYTLLFNMNPGEKLSRKVKYLWRTKQIYRQKSADRQNTSRAVWCWNQNTWSALLNVAGKTSWDEFRKNPERRSGRDMIGWSPDWEKQGFQWSSQGWKTEAPGRQRKTWKSWVWRNRTHRILKSAAAAVAVVMLTALVGMTAIADCRYPDKNTQTYQKTSVFEK